LKQIARSTLTGFYAPMAVDTFPFAIGTMDDDASSDTHFLFSCL
jgi:hypothetical protein